MISRRHPLGLRPLDGIMRLVIVRRWGDDGRSVARRFDSVLSTQQHLPEKLRQQLINYI